MLMARASREKRTVGRLRENWNFFVLFFIIEAVILGILYTTQWHHKLYRTTHSCRKSREGEPQPVALGGLHLFLGF